MDVVQILELQLGRPSTSGTNKSDHSFFLQDCIFYKQTSPYYKSLLEGGRQTPESPSKLTFEGVEQTFWGWPSNLASTFKLIKGR